MEPEMSVERERKYDVGEEVLPPRFPETIVARSEPQAVQELQAVYFDTEDRALSRKRVALRRRAGGSDEGWHIKRAATHGRLEQRWPLGQGAEDQVPDEVLRPLRVIIRDRPLTPLARLTTRRVVTTLLATDGARLAEFADDTVTATDAREGVVRDWREWEIELLEGAPTDHDAAEQLLDRLEGALLAAGAITSSSPAKIARAVGADVGGNDDVPGRPEDSSLEGGEPVPPGAAAVVAMVSELIDALQEADPAARLDQPDAVHRLRTLVRRLRSILAAHRRLFHRDTVAALRDRLHLLGAILGEVRDLEVRADRARSLLASLPAHLVDDGVTARLVDQVMAERSTALQRLLGFLDGTGYFRLLDALDAFRARPPVAHEGQPTVRSTVRKAVRHEARRVLDAIGAAGDNSGEHLHGVRKAARRLRYTVEAAVAVAPDEVRGRDRAARKRCERIQDQLGQHRDATAFAEYVLLTTRRAHAAGEPTFTYGLLYGLCTRTADGALADYGADLPDLRDQLRRLL